MRRTAKAWVAAIGSTVSAVGVSWVTVELAVSDGAFNADEIGSIVTAAIALVGTVYGVWRVPNEKQI